MADVNVAPGPRTATPEGTGSAAEVERRPAAAMGAWYESPAAFMRRVGEEMDRSFDRFFEGSGMPIPRFLGRGRELLRREAGFIPAEWSPRVDMLRREGQWIIRADIPGLSRDDIKVELTDDLLTIRGERREEKEEEQEGYSYRECNYGTFYRAIPLPDGVAPSQATATFRDGVLEVALPAPNPQETQARRLEIGDRG